jgi:hypothetical protein
MRPATGGRAARRHGGAVPDRRQRPASRRDDTFNGAAVEATKAALLEPGHARTVGLHGGADALQSRDDALPGVGDTGGIGRDQAQCGTAGEGLAETQPGAEAVGLCGGGRLADQLLTPDLRGQRQRRRGKGFATTRGDRELEAG